MNNLRFKLFELWNHNTDDKLLWDAGPLFVWFCPLVGPLRRSGAGSGPSSSGATPSGGRGKPSPRAADASAEARPVRRAAKVLSVWQILHADPYNQAALRKRRRGKLYRARSRLYRSRVLQVNTKYSLGRSWRDLQDLHAFAPLSIQKFNQNSSNCFPFSQSY